MRIFLALLLTPFARINNIMNELPPPYNNNNNMNDSKDEKSPNHDYGKDGRPLDDNPVESSREKINTNHHRMEQLKYLQKERDIKLGKQILDDFTNEYSIQGINIKAGGLLRDW